MLKIQLILGGLGLFWLNILIGALLILPMFFQRNTFLKIFFIGGFTPLLIFLIIGLIRGSKVKKINRHRWLPIKFRIIGIFFFTLTIGINILTLVHIYLHNYVRPYPQFSDISNVHHLIMILIFDLIFSIMIGYSSIIIYNKGLGRSRMVIKNSIISKFHIDQILVRNNLHFTKKDNRTRIWKPNGIEYSTNNFKIWIFERVNDWQIVIYPIWEKNKTIVDCICKEIELDLMG